MKSERKTYEERTPWALWVRVLYWAVVTLLCVAMLVGFDTALPLLARLAVAALMGGGAWGIHAFIGRLTVQVRETGLFLHLGSVPLIHRRVPFEEITGVETVTYRPMYEFGGWGVRGAGDRKAWTARGNRAVALDLTGGRQLLIGSDYPQRLEDRIRAAVGDGLDWSRRPGGLDEGARRLEPGDAGG